MATEFISNSWLMPTNANAEANRVSNYSLDFDGSSQYVNVGSISSLQNATEYSISSWFKTPLNNLYQVIYSWFDGADGYLQLLLVNDGSFVVYNYRTSNAYGISATGVVSADVWYNATVVFDGSGAANADRLKLYINDTLITLTYTGTIPTQTGTMLSSTMWLGASNSPNFWGLEGKLTELSIFDYSLSASQVTQLYGTGSAIGNPMAITNGRKPVAYYPLGNSAFNGEFLVPNGAEQDFVLSFNNSNINVGDIDNTSALSFSTWVSTTSTNASSYQNIAYKRSGSTGWFIQYLYGSGTNGKIKFFIFHSNGSGTGSEVTITNLQSGNWFNIALTYDGTDAVGALKLYSNGVEVYSNSSTLGGTGLAVNNDNLYIGGSASSAFFPCKLSNISLFDTGLPATGTESVESLYNYGTPPNIASYSNLQAWYELDASATFDGSNFSIPDASSNSNTGTSSGMSAANLVQSDLIINQSYDPFSILFDGNNDFIDCGSLSYVTSNVFTISGWVKTATSLPTYMPLFNFQNSSGIGSKFNWNHGASPILWYSGSTYKYFSSGTWRTDGLWHNVVLTIDKTTIGNSKMFIDGVEISGGTTFGSGSMVLNDLHLGYNPTTQFYEGNISNVSIYNSALSAAQVSTLYNEGKPFDLNTFAVTPIAWWRLGAVNSSYNSTSSEWTILDEIGTNNGTGSNLGPAQTALSDGVGATGSGLSSGMGSGENRKGTAPFSENNAVSYNLSVLAKSTSTPT